MPVSTLTEKQSLRERPLDKKEDIQEQSLIMVNSEAKKQPTSKCTPSALLLVRMGVRAFFLGTSLFGFMMWWEHPDYIRLIVHSKYAGKYEYLTYLGVAVTIGTIVTASAADLLQNLGTSTHGKKGHQGVRGTAARNTAVARNWLLAIAFPMETLITVLYWTLRAFDRSLLSSTHLLRRGEFLAVESDISNHLLPFFYVWAELLLFSPFIARPFVRQMAHKLALVACNGAYMAWSHFLFLKNKRWVYPLLGKLSTTQHFGLVATTTSLTLVTYLLGTALLQRHQ